MSPGRLLPPFSELVLSSLSQLFTAGGGGRGDDTAQEFTHRLLGDVCFSFQSLRCPSAQQHFSIPGCRPGQCCPPPCKLGSRIYLRRGHWSFPPFSLCSLQSTNTSIYAMGNTPGRQHAKMIDFQDGPPSYRLLQAGVKRFPRVDWEPEDP